ncbi:hypothetical protein J6590_052580 [Homalodisca vitripennis]|nr:hypothetical protein J6590_052580 [Homalodisca vitripennis]
MPVSPLPTDTTPIQLPPVPVLSHSSPLHELEVRDGDDSALGLVERNSLHV